MRRMPASMTRGVLQSALSGRGITLQQEEYDRVSACICEQLSCERGSDSTITQRRVHDYYMPVFTYIRHAEEKLSPVERPLVVGISAPQGCGKTTLTSHLQSLFSIIGKRVAVLSLDDFYLTAEKQEATAAEYPTNPLLRYRGNAGSHDIPLAMQTLDALLNLKRGPDSTASVPLPRYDKSLRQGRGDRAPPDTWPVVTEPVDIVLLEGWMLGFTFLADRELTGNDTSHLQDVNRYLSGYRDLHMLPHAWLVIEAEKLQYVYQWRQQQEEAMRDRGLNSMTDDQVRDFVDRFMPAYRQYLPNLLTSGPERRDIIQSDGYTAPAPVLKVTVGLNRLPLAATFL